MRQTIRGVDRPLLTGYLAVGAASILAFIEGVEDYNPAPAFDEGLTKRRQLVDRFCPSVNVFWRSVSIGNRPAHRNHAPAALRGMPNDDRQDATNAAGIGLAGAAFVFAAAPTAVATREGLAEIDNLSPGCQSRELAAHTPSLSADLAPCR